MRYGISALDLEPKTMERIPLDQAKIRLDELVQRAAAGEEIVIGDPDSGEVRLVPRPTAVATRKVTDAIGAALRQAYGDRIDRIVLYGSRARGDAGVESDFDIALFLHGMTDRFAESETLAHIHMQLMDATGEFVHVMAFPAGGWEQRTPLMQEVRTDGVDI